MRLVSRLSVAIALMAVVLVLPRLRSAQGSPTGTLAGTISDPSGGVLPGVTVTAKSVANRSHAADVSGGEGDWRIPALPLGHLRGLVRARGLQEAGPRAAFIVEAASTRSVPVTLEVGGLTETVKWPATPSCSSIDAPSTTVAQPDGRASSRPCRHRPGSFTHLLSSEAGVSADLPPVLTNGTGNISPSVNGTRTTSTSLFFNGIDATNLTIERRLDERQHRAGADMLQEVKLQTSMYDASTGRSGGGNFQLVTRSGTQRASAASANFNFQHEKMNSNDFFYKKDGIDKPKARRNEGGFTVGGPIRRNRVFFFGGYQRTQAETGFVPTASSITVLPQALQLIQGARTKENVLAAFSALNPIDPDVDSEGAVLRPHRHAPAFRTWRSRC